MWDKIVYIYWKVRYWVEKHFTDWRLRNRADKYKPFYDRFSKRYWLYSRDPNVFDEEGSIEYVVSEYIQDGLIYEYKINGDYSHEHSFDGVLQAVMDNWETFEIPEDVKDQYSRQELNIISKYLEKLRSE